MAVAVAVAVTVAVAKAVAEAVDGWTVPPGTRILSSIRLILVLLGRFVTPGLLHFGVRVWGFALRWRSVFLPSCAPRVTLRPEQAGYYAYPTARWHP